MLYGSKATLQRSARAAIARSPRALLSHRCRALSSLASLNRHLIPLSLRLMAACALLAAPVGPASDPPVPEAYGSLCPARSPCGAGICIPLSAFPSLHGCSLARRLRKESLDREVKLAAVLVSSDLYRNAQGEVT